MESLDDTDTDALRETEVETDTDAVADDVIEALDEVEIDFDSEDEDEALWLRLTEGVNDAVCEALADAVSDRDKLAVLESD